MILIPGAELFPELWLGPDLPAPTPPECLPGRHRESVKNNKQLSAGDLCSTGTKEDSSLLGYHTGSYISDLTVEKLIT